MLYKALVLEIKNVLLDLFMNRMLIAVGAEFLQFNPSRGVPTVLLGGVARNARRALVWVSATFRTL